MKQRVIIALLLLAAITASGAAGVWWARTGGFRRASGPLVLEGTVQSAEVPVEVKVAGKVRLVAVREGDTVKAGQLVAWLEAPELRDAAKAAQDQLKEAQDRLEELRSHRPSRHQSDYLTASEASETAERELSEAQERSRQVPELEARYQQALTDQEQAASELAAAETRLEEARTATGSRESDNGSLESGSAGGAISRANAAVAEAHQRKREADREVSAAHRTLRRAEAAARRIPTLMETAQRAAAALEDASSGMATASSQPTGPEDEDSLRRTVREAQQAAADANTHMKDAVVVSPAAGVVQSLAVRPEEALTAGQTIATIQRLDTIGIQVVVPTRDANRVRQGQAVTARSKDTGDATFKGTVSTVADTGDGVIATVVLHNAGATLRPGATVKITFP